MEADGFVGEAALYFEGRVIFGGQREPPPEVMPDVLGLAFGGRVGWRRCALGGFGFGFGGIVEGALRKGEAEKLLGGLLAVQALAQGQVADFAVAGFRVIGHALRGMALEEVAAAPFEKAPLPALGRAERAQGFLFPILPVAEEGEQVGQRETLARLRPNLGVAGHAPAVTGAAALRLGVRRLAAMRSACSGLKKR